MDNTLQITRGRELLTAVFLTWLTIGWMTIEGVVSVALGVASHSLLLEAFGAVTPFNN